MGNGAKAAQKRERNTQKGGPNSKGTKSQAKINEAAKTIICAVCKHTFLVTTRAPALEEHSESKHGKKMVECFPDFSK